ncbi:hypothetical protein [Tissierella sp.]|uniref:hypothetical protein n=1 Tax=Tissierella sp. TaxID=41274 RepID=UPI0028AE9904|nr:hypothetical protein [Tissierella sp.]
MINIEDVAKMSNEEIRDNIIFLNKKQLKLIKESSYLNAFNGINILKNMLKDRNQNENKGLISELNALDYYINKSINLLNKSIYELDEKKDLQLDEIMSIREEIYELSSIIDGYSIELSYIGELVDQYGIKILSKKDYENIPYNINRVEELIAIINDILNKLKDDYYKYIYIISQVVLTLPMRLVKENYFDILKDTIMRNLRLYTKVQVETQINEYKKQFDSSIRDGYGTKFDYYFREIQKLRNIKLSDKDLDELDTIVKEIINLTKEINEIFDYILRLGLISNMIIVITLEKDISISEEIRGIHERWMETITNENKESIDKLNSIIEKGIKKIEEDIFMDLEEFNILNSEALKRENFSYVELDEDLLYTKKILTYYNDTKLLDNKILFSEDDIQITQEYLEQIVDSLIQYINRSLSKMGNVERKVRMRTLLSEIELPFNGIEEFNNYIRYSLDNKVLPKEEINFTIDYLLYFLQDFINEQ